MMEITEAFSIPLSCPKCEGKMIAVKYNDPSQIYDEHSVQLCKECDYQIQTDDFKKRLLTLIGVAPASIACWNSLSASSV